MDDTYKLIAEATERIMGEILSKSELAAGQILVLGGSTSEVMGSKLGTKTNLEAGKIILEEILSVLSPANLYLAVQGCEHINRALVVEQVCALTYGLEIVNVVPHLRAGGGLATAAWEMFDQPVVVERIQGHAGIDIGETMIGMHLRPVVVPLRLDTRYVGQARVNAATTRFKLIGGERARYA